METKNLGISESKGPDQRRLRRRNAASKPPFPERGIVRPGPRRQGIGFASLCALDCCGPSLGDWLFMRERGELQRAGISTRTRLHKGAVLQPSGTGRAFKGLGVAKRYCRINVISDSFPQRRPGTVPLLLAYGQLHREAGGFQGGVQEKVKRSLFRTVTDYGIQIVV